jgi:hypothetical protein
MPTFKARVVPKPKEGQEETERVVIFHSFTGPVIRGGAGAGGDTYVCGECDATLVESIQRGSVRGILVIPCNNCGRFNEIVFSPDPTHTGQVLMFGPSGL